MQSSHGLFIDQLVHIAMRFRAHLDDGVHEARIAKVGEAAEARLRLIALPAVAV